MYLFLFFCLIAIGWILFKKYKDNKQVINFGVSMLKKMMEKTAPVDTAEKINDTLLVSFNYQGQRYQTLIPYQQSYEIDMVNIDVIFNNRLLQILPGSGLRVHPKELGYDIEVKNQVENKSHKYVGNQQPNFMEEVF